MIKAEVKEVLCEGITRINHYSAWSALNNPPLNLGLTTVLDRSVASPDRASLLGQKKPGIAGLFS